MPGIDWRAGLIEETGNPSDRRSNPGGFRDEMEELQRDNSNPLYATAKALYASAQYTQNGHSNSDCCNADHYSVIS